jgi:catechol 2,3-dioxygenase-like lactoylglutathione lyase family enzyme
MILNHLNLTVTNPEETSAFLAKYFGLQQKGGNKGMQLLNDDQGMVLTLFKGRASDREPPASEAADPARTDQVRYPSTFHIGFIQDSEARVDEINKRMRADGVAVNAPAVHHGAWAFYVMAPGGFVIEVMA